MHKALSGIVLLLAAGSMASAEPSGTAPADLLAQQPSVAISNGLINAKVYMPGGFYKGRRFDHSGQVADLIYKGQNYYGVWFQKTGQVQDFVYSGDDVIAGPNTAITGPVEEFDPLGYDTARPDGTFINVGVGVLKRNGGGAYDHFANYQILDEGQRATKVSKNSVTMDQTVSDKASGYGYSYSKTVRLVPGKAEMVIEHMLKNTGSKPIHTTVFNHNFLTLSPGQENVTITAPFAMTPDHAPAADRARFDGDKLVYQRALGRTERLYFAITGFGKSPKDFHFQIANSKTGYGLTMSGDQPLHSMDLWSITKVLALEPYIAIDLAPGQQKSWSLTYDYFGPGDKAH